MSGGGGELGGPDSGAGNFQTGALEKKLGEGRSGETAGGAGGPMGCSAPAPASVRERRTRHEGIMSGSRAQDSYLENPMDRGAWQDRVHMVTRTQLEAT